MTIDFLLGLLVSYLTDSSKVKVAALSRLFADTTNSYKHLFFLSLLDIMKRCRFEATEPISFQVKWTQVVGQF